MLRQARGCPASCRRKYPAEPYKPCHTQAHQYGTLGCHLRHPECSHAAEIRMTLRRHGRERLHSQYRNGEMVIVGESLSAREVVVCPLEIQRTRLTRLE